MWLVISVGKYSIGESVWKNVINEISGKKLCYEFILWYFCSIELLEMIIVCNFFLNIVRICFWMKNKIIFIIIL